MGPFSNNTPPPTPPRAPDNGSKLPVPDVNGNPHQFSVSTEPNNTLATKKWFTITMICVGITAALTLIGFLAYIVLSNTPGAIVGSAMQNLVTSDGEAGDIAYETKQGATTTTLTGTFLSYTDPTNRLVSSTTVSLGPSGARTSLTAQLFPDSNYFQTAGLQHSQQIAGALQQDTKRLGEDQATRLSTLDGQWYSLTGDDLFDIQRVLPRQLQSPPTSNDLETLKQLYRQHPFITAAQDRGDEQLEGVNTLHVTLGIDQAKLTAFLQAVKAADSKSLQLTDNDLAALQTTKPQNVDAWIARSDRTFRKIRIEQDPSHTLTLTFHSEQVAVQRQSVVRPTSAKSATSFVRGIEDILELSPTSTTR